MNGVTRASNTVSRPAGLGRDFATLVSLGVLAKIPGLTLVPAGTGLALLAAPVALARLRGWSRMGTPLATSAVLGALFALGARPFAGEMSSTTELIALLLWISAFPLVIGLGFWLIDVAGFSRATKALVLGATIGHLLAMQTLAWKGTTGILLTTLFLAYAAGKPLWLSRIVLVASAAVSAANDARGMVLFALVAFGATLLHTRMGEALTRNPIRGAAAASSAMLVLAFAAYRAMLGGWFGEAVELRTASQAARGTNPIIAVRAEWAAAGEVAQAQPWGYGAGVIAPPEVQSSGIAAVGTSGGDYRAPYFRTSVFGERHDFHSTVVNLWYHFGLPGTAVALTLAVMLITAVPYCASRVNDVGILAAYAISVAGWDLMFSPMADGGRIILGAILAGAVVAGREWRPTGRRGRNPLRHQT